MTTKGKPSREGICVNWGWKLTAVAKADVEVKRASDQEYCECSDRTKRIPTVLSRQPSCDSLGEFTVPFAKLPQTGTAARKWKCGVQIREHLLPELSEAEKTEIAAVSGFHCPMVLIRRVDLGSGGGGMDR